MCEEKYSGSERFFKNSEVAGYRATEALGSDCIDLSQSEICQQFLLKMSVIRDDQN